MADRMGSFPGSQSCFSFFVVPPHPPGVGYILIVKGLNREKWQPDSSHES